jgi:peptide/nickel transport system substrate-binding protein
VIRHIRSAIVGVATLALVAVACGGGSSSSSSGSQGAQPTSGGTIREETQSFGWTDDFDPTGEYLGSAWALLDELLMRGLMTYTHTSAADGGNVPVPDLAVAPPTISSDGLTYTFEMKSDVMFGPPLDRAVTSKDILFAFQRINDLALAAQYGLYYDGVIKGIDGQQKSMTAPISGIQTPDDTHIIFTLEQPTGDFLYRLAFPATKAIPPEVGKCFTKAGEYGKDVISSGPYMIMGQDQLDISSCASIKPISGYNVEKGMTLVRNPNQPPGSDDNRPAYADGIQIAINTSNDDIFNRLLAGDIDFTAGTPPTDDLQQFEDPSSQYSGWLHADPGDRTWYITMNLLVPPFDDVHVRKAANLVLDKIGIRKQYGGDLRGQIATTVEPPTVNAAGANINPYSANDGNGNLDAAKQEFMQSSYDTNKNGVCDDGPVCDNILFTGRSEAPWPNMEQVAAKSLQGILPGIKLQTTDTSTGYVTLGTATKLIPISMVPGWGKDYNSPFGFDYAIFDNVGNQNCPFESNYAHVGITAETATSCKIGDAYNAYVAKNGPVPSVDKAITDCVAKPADQVNDCFAQNVDTPLMNDIVPWVPWGWSTQFSTTNNTTVNHFEFDANANWFSYVRSSVTNGLQPKSVT